jgi:hypothetical protein
MKKLLVIVLMSSLCFACSKDDPLELGIKTLEISLYPEDVVQIDAISDFDITYLSSNPYLVEVSEAGLLTANKVGKTRVEVSSHDRILEVSVDVMGRYNIYPDPIVDWSLSQSELIAIAGEPDEFYSDAFIQYNGYSDKASSIAYLFSEGNLLVNTIVMVPAIYSDDFFAYMDERFIFDAEDDGILIYGNANKEEDVTAYRYL